MAVLTAGRLALVVGASWHELVSENEATNAVLGLAFALLGVLAVADRPRNGLSWLFVAEGIVQRFRNGDAVLRAQVGWLLLALAVNLAVSFLPSELPGLVAAGLMVLALGLAVVRYRLYAVERLFNRAAVYGALTAGVVGIFAIFAWLIGGRLNDTVFGTVLAAVVVALGVGPAREWLQRLVDRLMYGRRSDPYGALAGLGRQLEQAPAETGLLSSIAAGVADALRLPYVAISLADEAAPAAVSGILRGRSVDLPLVHASEQIGQLTVGLRRGERRLTERDTALLADFARLVAVAAKEVSLAADLRRSRERLVIAREEVRRRLRRELHDGVGPALAGLALGVGAANRAVARGDATAGPLLVDTVSTARTAGRQHRGRDRHGLSRGRGRRGILDSGPSGHDRLAGRGTVVCRARRALGAGQRPQRRSGTRSRPGHRADDRRQQPSRRRSRPYELLRLGRAAACTCRRYGRNGCRRLPGSTDRFGRPYARGGQSCRDRHRRWPVHRHGASAERECAGGRW
jgi:signal transduction histidine kinase